MSERTNLTNLLLLVVLASILLVSGSLQCAFDCLTQAGSLQSEALHTLTERIDTCHPSFEHASPSLSCLNKACHQRLPDHRNLGGPEIYRLAKLAQPIYSNSRQPAPQYRAGQALALPLVTSLTDKPWHRTISRTSTQTLLSIRTTVLLC